MTEPYPGIEILEVIAEAHNYNAWLTDIVAEGLGTSTSVADFGAGSGTFARRLRDQGRTVLCIEPDRTLAGRLRGEGFEVYDSTVALPAGKVSAVYSLNVLEHIEDDVGALAGLHRLMGSGGRLVLFVPAFPILFSSFDARYGHRRRYRKHVLRARVEAAGFRVLTCRYADSLGFIAALAFKLLDRGAADLSRTAVRIYDDVLFPISRRLDSVAANCFGKNVFLIAEKI